MSDTVAFNGTEYTQASLAAMSVDDLLVLRNEVAASMDISSVNGFKSPEAGVAQTLKALQRSVKEADAPKKTAKKAKAPAKPKGPRALSKSAEAKTIKRPTQKMFAVIKKTGEHDGTQGRQHRWDNYKDGMTMVQVIEGSGTEPWDVHTWVGKGIMSLTEPSDAAYPALKAAWYKRHKLTDPDVVKADKAAATAARKVEREEGAKKAKALADAKKAEKAAKAKAA